MAVKTGSVVMRAAILMFSVLTSRADAQATVSHGEPYRFLTERIGLTGNEIAAIANGGAVVKVLPSKTPAEIIVFGAIFVHASPDEYVRMAFDLGRLRKLPGYMGVGRLSDPPALSDMTGFTLEPGDIGSLKTCRPGNCGVQLPAEAMKELQRALDWSGPNVATHVNDRVRNMGLEMLREYRRDGDSVLGNYHDKHVPFDAHAELRSVLGRSDALPVYLPELDRYLLDYPAATPEKAATLFYWEKVVFGLKPTLRLNHAMAYRSQGPLGAAQVVAIKQLYASHYLQLALDLTACVPDSAGKGFFLISFKGSVQQGLAGFRGALVRRIVVSRARSTQEKNLTEIRKALEGSH